MTSRTLGRSLSPGGGGLGRGVVVVERRASANTAPHPQPLPTRGRGARRVRGTLAHQSELTYLAEERGQVGFLGDQAVLDRELRQRLGRFAVHVGWPARQG